MSVFDLNCKKCARLSEFLENLRQDYPDYHNLPVVPFGVKQPQLLVVGLAPGMHGANATGRPFTGDHAGILLYETLYQYGFSTAPVSVSKVDGLKLIQCCITNAVKCLPPENKPTTPEINECNQFLRHEITSIKKRAVILALGTIAHKAVLRAFDYKQSKYKFSHGAQYQLDNNFILLDSYHCSRYNTQTKRLTPDMFQQIFQQARIIIDAF